MNDLGLIHTALFVPGNRLERVDKALATGADVVIIDLEDAAPPAQKGQARADVAQKLADTPGCRIMAIQVDGKFVDLPVVERARRTLRLASALRVDVGTP